MFTVKLNSGITFTATAAEENYGPAFFQSAEQRTKCLKLESSEDVRDLDWYLEKLGTEGALDKIQIYSGDKVCMTAVGYTRVREVSRRMLPTGNGYLSIMLDQREMKTVEEGTES